LIPAGMAPVFQLTLTDDRDLAYAIVIISARSD